MNMGYRERLYNSYVSAHLGKDELEKRLSVRGPFMEAIVLTHFPAAKDSRIAELGCGYGALIHYARKLGYANIYGIDVSPEQVVASRQLGIPGVEQGDIRTTLKDTQEGSLDAVVTIDVIEHLTRDEVLEFVDDVYRVLRKGGCWITHQPNAVSPFFGRIRYGDMTHEMAYTAKSIRQLALSCGFSSVVCHEDEPVAHGLKSSIRRVIWRFLSRMLAVFLAVEAGATGEIFSQNFLAVAVKS